MRLYMLVNLIEYKVQYYCSFCLLWYFLLSDAAGSFSSADLSQLKEGMARMTGKVRISIWDIDCTKKHCLSVRNGKEPCWIICECSSAIQVFLHLAFFNRTQKIVFYFFHKSLMNKRNHFELLLWYLPKHKQINIVWFQKISMPLPQRVTEIRRGWGVWKR